MAKQTIYIGDALRKRMDERPDTNWSAVAQAAFEREIVMLDGGELSGSPTDPGKHVDPVARLRQSRFMSERNTPRDAYVLGQHWVLVVASYQDVQMMSAMLGEYDPSEVSEEIVDVTFGGDFWELQASGRNLAWIRDDPEAMRQFWEGATAAWEPIQSAVEKD